MVAILPPFPLREGQVTLPPRLPALDATRMGLTSGIGSDLGHQKSGTLSKTLNVRQTALPWLPPRVKIAPDDD